LTNINELDINWIILLKELQMDYMLSLSDLTSIFMFMFIMVITPGPNNIMMLTSGLNFGYKKTIPHMLGVAIGFSLMVLGVGLGLGVLFMEFPLIADIIKLISIMYLFYIAYKIATNTSINTKNDGVNEGKPFTFIQICFFQLINSKAWIMVLTAVSLFTDGNENTKKVIVIAIVTILVSIISTNTWTLGGVALKKFINNSKKLKIFNYFMAVLLIFSVLPFVF
jgi:threonine/homoserine/homoserine lactone efflux protein